MKRAQNARKRHFSAQYAVLLMCALLCYMAFLGFLRLLLRSQHVRTRVHTLSGFCWLALPLPHSRLNAVQRYDTKTILTNFCVKISQWNVFLGRRRHFCRIVLCRRLRHTWQKRHAFNTEYGRRLRHTWPEYTWLKPYKAAMRNAYDWMMAATVFLPRTTDLLSTWNANLMHVI